MGVGLIWVAFLRGRRQRDELQSFLGCAAHSQGCVVGAKRETDMGMDEEEDYEPLLGYVVLEQAQAAEVG